MDKQEHVKDSADIYDPKIIADHFAETKLDYLI